MKTAVLRMNWISGERESDRTFPLTQTVREDGFTLIPEFRRHGIGDVFTLTLIPDRPLVLRHISIAFTPEIEDPVRIMLNGYQSWTQSREVNFNYTMSDMRSFMIPLLGSYGDYTKRDFSRTRGHFYSWSYTHLRRKDGTVRFYGSPDEKFAFTILDYKSRTNEMTIEKEVDDLVIEGPCVPFNLFSAGGVEQDVWDSFASLLAVDRSRIRRLTGWTSWYSLYTHISEESVLAYLKAVRDSGLAMDVFQIDDGYQHAVGDWLEPNSRFPNGMKPVAEEIRKAGFIPGLWVSPYICERVSHIYRDHPDWLLRDREGRAVRAGFNYHWSGFFYALDPELPEVREYIREVFRTVYDDWGFQMVKLDFLYAACLLPAVKKSRGRIMTESMEFLRAMAGNRLVLGCGVPLGAAPGTVDYCRIGSDVSPFWEDRFLSWVRYEERVSTYNSLLSTLSRWQQSGRFFGNDPDVFILRDDGNNMTPDQRRTLFLVNNLLGKLVFFSDNPLEYTPLQRKIIDSMFPVASPSVREVVCDESLYTIRMSHEGRSYTAYVNLGGTARSVVMEETGFTPEEGLLVKGAETTLSAFRSLCFVLLPDLVPDDGVRLLGTSHLLPGSDVGEIRIEGNSVRLGLKPGFSESGEAYFLAPADCGTLIVNGRTVECVSGEASPYRHAVVAYRGL